jgi:hydrogenase maturation protein HypF
VNAILSRGIKCRLVPMGISVLEAREAPANDGGIALGQAWVAMERIS